MIETLQLPPSQVDTLLAQAEHTFSLEDQATRTIPLMHSLWVTETANAFQADEELMVMKRHMMMAGKDGVMYLQPRIPYPDRGEQDFIIILKFLKENRGRFPCGLPPATILFLCLRGTPYGFRCPVDHMHLHR